MTTHLGGGGGGEEGREGGMILFLYPSENMERIDKHGITCILISILKVEILQTQMKIKFYSSKIKLHV